LRNHGQGVDDALLQYLSPLGWEHINLTGDYLWRSSAKVGAGKFRLAPNSTLEDLKSEAAHDPMTMRWSIR
jgi:hypothetical protein